MRGIVYSQGLGIAASEGGGFWGESRVAGIKERALFKVAFIFRDFALVDGEFDLFE